MSRSTFSDDFFDMFYDDWMITGNIKIEKNLLGMDLAHFIEKKYPENTGDETDEKYTLFYNKALALQQKIVMMQYAKANYFIAKADFESTQNMTIPAFYGMGATGILFYIETIVVLARNALDISASIYSEILLNTKNDSFNDLSKKILKGDNKLFTDLKHAIEKWGDNPISAYRLLCGTTKGRALRDIIIHQSVINLQYFEYKVNSEKEKLFLVLKGIEPICLDDFVNCFMDELFEIFRTYNRCCELVLNDENSL